MNREHRIRFRIHLARIRNCKGFRGFFRWKVRSELQLWLLLQKGDIIDVVQMNKSGLWKGVLHNRIGHFKFINVEILNDRVPRRGEPEGRGKWGQRYRQKPGSVQELLQRMNLQVESNILPRLEQTDSHLHRFECKAGKPAFIRFFIRLDLSLFIHIPPPRLASLACTFYIAYNTQFHENLACSFFRRHFFFLFFFFFFFYIHLPPFLISSYRFPASRFYLVLILFSDVTGDECSASFSR